MIHMFSVHHSASYFTPSFRRVTLIASLFFLEALQVYYRPPPTVRTSLFLWLSRSFTPAARSTSVALGLLQFIQYQQTSRLTAKYMYRTDGQRNFYLHSIKPRFLDYYFGCIFICLFVLNFFFLMFFIKGKLH